MAEAEEKKEFSGKEINTNVSEGRDRTIQAHKIVTRNKPTQGTMDMLFCE
jgi:hypothetical protein